MANGYLGVGDSSHRVKGLYVGVDGTARKVKKAYVGVNGMARLWYQAGTPLGELAVGSIVKLNVDGVATNFIVVQHGKPRDSSRYDNCDGTWLLMQDIYATSTWSSFSMSVFNNIFDADVQSVVKETKIPTGVEVGFSDIGTGSLLSYFSGASNSKRIAYYNGKATAWWLDSTYYSSGSFSSGNRYYVTTSGGSSKASPSSYTYGIRPAFILPSTVLVDDSNNVIT